MLFTLKWMGVALLPLLAVWGVWRLVRQPDARPVAPAVAESESPVILSSPPVATTTQAAPSPSPSPVEKAQVQVLNGTATVGLAQRARERLEQAGFEVLSVGNARTRYDKTTVFFKPGFESIAREIARVIGATVVQPAPENLQRDIPITAVVGADFSP